MNQKYKTSKYMLSKADALIEGWYTYGSTENYVLLLPPHPGLGGTVSNSILRLITEAFCDLGFAALRINFRGVGLSKGNPNDRSMDLHDALSSLDWLCNRNPDFKSLWVAGFGYGGHITINMAMRRPGVHGFLAVTPYADDSDFSVLTPCPNGMVIYGSGDQIILPNLVKRMANELASQKGCSIVTKEVKGADHNYTNHREVLKGEIVKYLTAVLEQERKTISTVSYA